MQKDASAVGLSDLQAMLFDFDGTLVQLTIDFEAMRRRVLDAAQAHGGNIQGRERMFTLEVIELVVAELAQQDPQRALDFRREADEAVLDEELQAAEHASPFPGVAEFLQLLRDQGLHIGIVTRNCRRAVEQIITRHQLAHDVLLTRDDVARVKPHPEHLETALRLLGVSSSRTCMVGDHTSDIEVGHAVGAWTIGIQSPNRPPDFFQAAHPDAVLTSVTEIPAYLAAHPFRRKL